MSRILVHNHKYELPFCHSNSAITLVHNRDLVHASNVDSMTNCRAARSELNILVLSHPIVHLDHFLALFETHQTFVLCKVLHGFLNAA